MHIPRLELLLESNQPNPCFCWEFREDAFASFRKSITPSLYALSYDEEITVLVDYVHTFAHTDTLLSASPGTTQTACSYQAAWPPLFEFTTPHERFPLTLATDSNIGRGDKEMTKF